MINTETEAIDFAIEKYGPAERHGAYRNISIFKAKKGPYVDCWHVVYWDIRHPWDDGKKLKTCIFDKEGNEKKVITHT